MPKVFPFRRIAALILCLLASIIPALAAPGDGHWDRQFNSPGVGAAGFAMRYADNKLYVAGYLLSSGSLATNTLIYIHDGTNWTTLSGISGSSGTTVIYDLARVGNDLYVCGLINRAGGNPAVGLARWNGTTWSDVGGFSGVALRLATDGTNLYVGGSFTNCGGIFATNVAKWNGTNWSALGAGIGYFDNFTTQVAGALLWTNGQLYVGGAFTNAGAVAATNLARWDGNTWSAIGGGVTGTSGFNLTPIMALRFLGNDLYVGGNFTRVGGNVPATNVAVWNGSAWSALGTGLRGPPNSSAVNALAVLGTDLYATGNFTNAGGVTARVAKWNGSTWSSLGAINGTGLRAETAGSSVYICGDFNMANFDTPTNVIGNHLLRWDGSAWQGVPGKGGNGTHFFVQTVAKGDDGLYMGGLFNAAGSNVTRRIARWDGSNWFALGSGVDGIYNGNSLAVRALRARNNEVFVGGAFVNAGGMTANNIAKWDGANWSTLGYGVDSTVIAIETGATDVYVGGSFTNAADSQFAFYTVNRIARWDPATGWWPLGTGMSGTVNVIRQQGSLVYAGGAFTSAGGNTANRIAVWDGVTWSSLGVGTANGLNGTVNAILIDGTDVYVGGSFTMAGGATARAIAKWNGSAWSPLGQGMFSTSTPNVFALAKLGSYLYASGSFTNAGGNVVTRNIARWDGTTWEGLGSGVGNEGTIGATRGNALAVWEDDLFVGGVFETAGVADSGYIARWNDQIDFTPPTVMRLSNAEMLAGNNFKFRATATEGASYVVEYASDFTTWTPLLTNGAASLDVTNSASGANVRHYRMRQVP